MGMLYKKIQHCLPGRESESADYAPPRALAPIAPGRRTGHAFDADIAVDGRIFGTGMNGDVRLARSNFGFSKCAVKRMKKEDSLETSRKLVETEVALHLAVDHPGIVRLYQVFETDVQVHMVMEALTGGDLFSRVQKEGRLDDELGASLTKQMLQAISHLHGLCIVHCDIKLENFVFERRGGSTLKLIDFGLAQQCMRGEKLTEVRGTLHYMAPEILKSGYTEAADMWSLGVVLYVMLCGRTPWATSDTKSLKMIKAGRPRICKELFRTLSGDAQQLIKALLIKNPARRPRPSNALQCQWMLQLARSAPSLDPDILQNIRGTMQAPPLSRAALWIATLCMPLQKSAPGGLRKQFSAFGAGHDGIISRDSFRTALTRSGVPSAEVQAIFELVDVDSDGLLTYSNFLAAAAITPADLDEEALGLVFHILDFEGRQRVTESGLLNFFGASLGRCRAKAMISEADQKGNGYVSMEEFRAYFSRLRGEKQMESAPSRILSVGKSAALSFASWSIKAVESFNENEVSYLSPSKFIESKSWA